MNELINTLTLCGLGVFTVVFSFFSAFMTVDFYQRAKDKDITLKSILNAVLALVLMVLFISTMVIATPIALTSFVKLFALTWNL